jgi:hypothetical protein
MRWSRQRPSRRAVERNEAEIARWVAEGWSSLCNARTRSAWLCLLMHGGEADPAGAADLGTAGIDAGATPPGLAWQAAVDVWAGGLSARPGQPGGAGGLDGFALLEGADDTRQCIRVLEALGAQLGHQPTTVIWDNLDGHHAGALKPWAAPSHGLWWSTCRRTRPS